MEKNRLKVWIVLCIAFVLIIMIAIGSVLDKEKSNFVETTDTIVQELTNVPELIIHSSIEDNEWIILKTTYGDFRYSKALSDVLYVESINKENFSQLAFGVVINESKVLAYTIHFNENSGSYCGILNLDENHKAIPVCVTFEQVDSSIPTEWQNAFYAVQETVNEVLSSMGESGKFISAE